MPITIVAANGPPCCSSSSSDEELVITDNGGWPSVVSVLETPDRRRVRKSLRSAKRTASAGDNPPPPPASSSLSTAANTIAASSSASAAKFFSSSPSNNHAIVGCPPPIAHFSSPPVTKRRLPSTEFSSPTLRTPRLAIHLSGSPLRSFFIRERRQKGFADAVDTSPRSSCSSSSGSAQNNGLPVLRPLNLHNYMGIRFSGEQPEQLIRTQIVDPTQVAPPDENGFAEAAKRKKPSSSDDSGFFDSSNSSASFLNQSATIETPSKGLISIQPSSSSSSSISLLHQQFSPRLLLSPSHHPSPFPAPLLLEFGNNSDLLHPTSFHSPIPEQSYGPLEASVLHGIMSDWDRMQPGPSSSYTSNYAQSPAKTPAGTPRHGIIRKPSPRCPNFERKLQILKKRRESPRKTKAAVMEWWRTERRGPIPSKLFVEGMNEWMMTDGDGSEREEGEEENGRPEKFALLFPKLDARKFQLMFGQSTDQLEVTRQAHAFLKSRRNRWAKGGGRPITGGGHTKSAGLPAQLAAETRISLDREKA